MTRHLLCVNRPNLPRWRRECHTVTKKSSGTVVSHRSTLVPQRTYTHGDGDTNKQIAKQTNRHADSNRETRGKFAAASWQGAFAWPCTHVPRSAVVNPRVSAHVEKIGMTDPSSQSFSAAATTPYSRISGALKTLHAYTDPTDSCTANDAGTLRYRLYPGPATMASREKKYRARSTSVRDSGSTPLAPPPVALPRRWWSRRQLPATSAAEAGRATRPVVRHADAPRARLNTKSGILAVGDMAR